MPYVAIVLTEDSRQLLLEKLKGLIPNEFEIIAHHCTIRMGHAKPTDSLRQLVSLTVGAIAQNDKVMAALVVKGGELSDNATPHVTVAVNRAAGGKPVHSNSLSEWEEIPFICLQGTIEQC